MCRQCTVIEILLCDSMEEIIQLVVPDPEQAVLIID